MTLALSDTFDVIVAGGGAAGCVLAGRLSEDADRRVLLLEAGPDAAAPGAEHPDILDPFALTATANAAFMWPDSRAETGALRADGTRPAAVTYMQGFSVGGGSNINGMGADRGLPEDYDGWRDFGLERWGWNDVLPYFVKLERDLDFSGPEHGNRGPVPLRRVPRPRWGAFCETIGQALERRGYPFLEDYKTDFREGFGSTPMNCLPDRRVSAASAYLDREVRNRSNLMIVPHARALRLSLDGQRANGVFVAHDGETKLVKGGEVVVSCGALQSPTLLLRSGIGPADHLRAHGIDVVHDLPGVGRNLHNHPCVRIVCYLPGAAAQPADNITFLQHWMRFSSNHPECHEKDMHLITFNKMGWHDVGRHVGSLAVTALKSYSKGFVELRSADPSVPPHVAFDLLNDARDFDRLVTGTRFALELLADPSVTRIRGEVFMPNYRIAAALGRRNRRNALAAKFVAAALDRAVLRRLFLRPDRIDVNRLADDEDAIGHFVRTTAGPQLHPLGSCRMGRADDPEAVVDEAGRVHGIDGLRVVDASIFPTITRGYTHFLVLMAAEKLADSIKGGNNGV